MSDIYSQFELVTNHILELSNDNPNLKKELELIYDLLNELTNTTNDLRNDQIVMSAEIKGLCYKVSKMIS